MKHKPSKIRIYYCKYCRGEMNINESCLFAKCSVCDLKTKSFENLSNLKLYLTRGDK